LQLLALPKFTAKQTEGKLVDFSLDKAYLGLKPTQGAYALEPVYLLLRQTKKIYDVQVKPFEKSRDYFL
jgi:hypothetical protein